MSRNDQIRDMIISCIENDGNCIHRNDICKVVSSHSVNGKKIKYQEILTNLNSLRRKGIIKLDERFMVSIMS